MTEPILTENPDRFCIFPIKHKSIWDFYKQAEASFWTAEELDFADDKFGDVIRWRLRPGAPTAIISRASHPPWSSRPSTTACAMKPRPMHASWMRSARWSNTTR